MCISVDEISVEEFNELNAALPTRTQQEKDVKKKFKLTTTQRAMIKELIVILKPFQFMTNELQSNRVNISRVIPGYRHIKTVLENKASLKYKPVHRIYTNELADSLLAAVDKRFGKVYSTDHFVLGTLLDCNFGIKSFPQNERANALSILKTHLHNTKVTPILPKSLTVQETCNL
jgi:hypothetical protein